MHIASIGIDLGKTTFHLVALGEQNKVLLRKKFSRPQLLAYTGKLPAALIGLEACIGAHFVGTALREQGHEVRLSPAQFVKPYRKSNKNDLREWAAVRSNEFHHNYRISSKRGISSRRQLPTVSRTPPWLPSGWECRGRRLSIASGSPGTRPGLLQYHAATHRHGRGRDAPAHRWAR
jgi:hypothetical protein